MITPQSFNQTSPGHFSPWYVSHSIPQLPWHCLLWPLPVNSTDWLCCLFSYLQPWTFCYLPRMWDVSEAEVTNCPASRCRCSYASKGRREHSRWQEQLRRPGSHTCCALLRNVRGWHNPSHHCSCSLSTYKVLLAPLHALGCWWY